MTKLNNTKDRQGKWKWVSANKLIHIHCDDILEIAKALKQGNSND